MLLPPPFFFFCFVDFLEFLVELHLFAFSFFLPPSPFRFQGLFILQKQIFEQLIVMVIEIIKGNHTFEPSSFIFLIIEVSSLTVGFDLIVDIFDFLQFGLCVEVLLLFGELFYLLAHSEDCLKILQKTIQFAFMPLGNIFFLAFCHIVQSDKGLLIYRPFLMAIKSILHQKFLYLLLLLRVEQGIIFILGVGVAVESEQVDRGRPPLLLLQHLYFQVSTPI